MWSLSAYELEKLSFHWSGLGHAAGRGLSSNLWRDTICQTRLLVGNNMEERVWLSYMARPPMARANTASVPFAEWEWERGGNNVNADECNTSIESQGCTALGVKIHPAELTLGLHIDLTALGTLQRKTEEKSSSSNYWNINRTKEGAPPQPYVYIFILYVVTEIVWQRFWKKYFTFGHFLECIVNRTKL